MKYREKALKSELRAINQIGTSYAKDYQKGRTLELRNMLTMQRKVEIDKLSVVNKLCFAIGGAPYQITSTALGFYLQIYLLDVAQLDPFFASIILFGGRAWDAFTDPSVGFLVSRSPWTRFGRMFPWIMLSTPLAVISYFFIWYVPPFEDGKVMWYLFFYILFQSSQTCYHVPYSALTMFISNDQKERDSATAYRMTVEVLGTVLGTAIHGQIVGMAQSPCIPGPDDVMQNLTNLSKASGLEAVILSPEDTRGAYMIASSVIGFIYILCAFVMFFGLREQKCSGSVDVKETSLFEGIKLVLGYGPYAKLLMVFLFTSSAFLLLEGNVALFCSYTLGFKNEVQNILLVIMLSAASSIPIWQWFLSQFGKKAAVYTGTLLVIPVLVPLACIKVNLLSAYIFAFAVGFAVSSAFLLPWSMLPDAVDDFRVNCPNHTGQEAIFYSFFLFFTRFASGVSLGISTLCLYFAGYINKGCSQPEEVHLTLKLLISAVPTVLIIIGLSTLYLYPIDEKRRKHNMEQLKKQVAKEGDPQKVSP